MRNNQMLKEVKESKQSIGNVWALLPLGVFLIVYLLSSIITKDFYKMPVSVGFVIAAIVGISMNKTKTIEEKLDTFCKGAGNSSIILMCLIFILAGSFAQTAKDMGAVESVVNLGLSVLPSNLMVVGIFVIGCFISLSIGTSVGTIVALTPVAVAISQKLGIEMGLILGAVVGGAMFGDNLSMISDTTIAATKSQGAQMKDKFKSNLILSVPTAIITIIILYFLGGNHTATLDGTYSFNVIKIIPYLAVLIGALMGINVMKVLVVGIVLSGFIGIYTKGFDFWGFINSISKGMLGMGELIIISLIVGGIVELIKANGGIDYVIEFIKKRIKGETGAKLGIALLVSFIDICTANNTVAIVMTGPIAKEIGEEYNLQPKKVASILDIFSCIAQGGIPYGAQLLMAASLAGISSFAIMKFLFYPYLLAVITMTAILLKKV
ncbi:Na+/H+ antiporter NhaC family protein [Hathewaya limosa]|uniref:Na+/H+ antiporter NhaC n=1 Tax=Hathewaya limosa TaxID=1536 RepID=A0ABU0JPF6_HATLI|nr:Na+/H+ antiporter NhaC [Hathewaya limosa]